MPFEVKLLKHVQFIHPLKRNNPYATNAITWLALQLIKVLGSKFYLVFNINSNANKDELAL